MILNSATPPISQSECHLSSVKVPSDALHGSEGVAFQGSYDESSETPYVSLITPAYNEAAILERNLAALCKYMRSLEDEYSWEILVINDGSHDDTGFIAESFAQAHRNVRVVHHPFNRGLGQALRTGFAHARGECVITLDLDLSYAPEHISLLLDRMKRTGAAIVVTSPYMEGGRVSNVPWLRRELSVWANRFLSLAAKRNVATLTGMVRAYDRRFLQSLNLTSDGMDINPEIIHKAMLLHERIEEIPAHLCWRSQPSQPTSKGAKRPKRKSSMKILRHSWSVLFYGFLFRPVMFFIIPSFLFFLLSCYANAWVLIHCWTNYQELVQTTAFPDPTVAVASAFQQAPHAFIIGGMLLMLSIQLFSLGVLSLQSKRYFEEVYYLGTRIYRSTRSRES